MNFRQNENIRDISAISALSPAPSPLGLPFGFTPASAAVGNASSNYRALSFACTPTLQFQHPGPSPKQQQQAVQNSPSIQEQAADLFFSDNTSRLQRTESWQVPYCTSVSRSGTSNKEPKLSLPLVPEELDDYGLRFGTFAVTRHTNGPAVLDAVHEALAKHRHLRVLPDNLTPGTINCVTYPQGVAIRFVIRVFRLTEEDQESDALQGLRGRNLVAVEEIESNDCMCAQRPIISQIFLNEIRNGEFCVPFAFENVPQGGCLLGRPCEHDSMERNSVAAAIPSLSSFEKQFSSDDNGSVIGNVKNYDEACLQLLKLASRPQYVDVQEQVLCIIARQSSRDRSFARALARVDGLKVLLRICAPKQSSNISVCVATAIANIAEAIVGTSAGFGVDVEVKKDVTELANSFEKFGTIETNPADAQVLQQIRRALQALDR